MHFGCGFLDEISGDGVFWLVRGLSHNAKIIGDVVEEVEAGGEILCVRRNSLRRRDSDIL